MHSTRSRSGGGGGSSNTAATTAPAAAAGFPGPTATRCCFVFQISIGLRNACGNNVISVPQVLVAC